MKLKGLKLFLLFSFSLLFFISCSTNSSKDSRHIIEKSDLNARMDITTDDSNNKYLTMSVKNGTDFPFLNCVFKYKYDEKEITVLIDETILKDERITGFSLEPVDKNFDMNKLHFIEYKVTFLENDFIRYCIYTGATEDYISNLSDIKKSDLDLTKIK